ncbi:carbamoyltransferase HypF [Ferrimonas balearica]|uniref:carbamoyltransferase HypF n=1 Tax=Ferrimonas balearica TaxID=44012 RepID=UPI001C99C6CC|nr:carbamoyltransferase HypF [Ferrimonas balearica]MBY5921600.1 carbamoyltransferase HypF [Ferrimonas balearica]MBY5995060.1 carbamoyltransferase HypF [Ferrimonas balearica]
MNGCNGIAIRIRGQVQGVGFRPFIWQLAREAQLRGEVFNDSDGVLIRLCNPVDGDAFVRTMRDRLPPLARVDAVELSPCCLDPEPCDFTITRSVGGTVNTRIAPDTATCPACLAEVEDPQDRRHRYPFTNCTHCGPRFTIIRQVPYDRPYTSMANFPLCPDCQREYEDPADRRFHAQPNACPVCGPTLTLQDPDGTELAQTHHALSDAVSALKAGEIVAIKALGGYHLAVDASNEAAVARLRERKHRPTKPFALMVADRAMASTLAHIEEAEAQALSSAAAPIVLLRPRSDAPLAPSVAPKMARLGVMLASNPLQHLLLAQMGRPLVMTSGNASGRPPCIDDAQALRELGPIADKLLMHNRDIVNRADDSILMVEEGQTQLLRRARGYVPSPIALPKGFEDADGVLAYGPDLKNTFCVLRHGQALLSAHLGDLADPDLFSAYQKNLERFPALFDFHLALRTCDSHPGYLSQQLAQQGAQQDDLPLEAIDHHHAHLAACLADNAQPLHTAPVLGLVLDGLGWGGKETEHRLWGGEILLGDYHQCRYLEGLPPVALPGGDLAAKAPWRNLVAHLDESCHDWEELPLPVLDRLREKPLGLLRQGIASGLNCPEASSTGRLFDAVAALLTDVFEQQHFEGEAAMVLEALAWQAADQRKLTLPQRDDLDLSAIWYGLLEGLNAGHSAASLALQFHQELAGALVGRLVYQAKHHQVDRIALSGGVMQNRLLQRLLVQGLKAHKLIVLRHHQVPANDGGLALGQALIGWARHQTSKERHS